ncbi:hypothetical protein AALB47_18495 [Lachnospiraceae bacterium 54-11]
MGFLDSMKKKFDEETKRAQEREQHSNYRTVVQADSDRIAKFSSRSDGDLINRHKNLNTSEEDKDVIADILGSRGYVLSDGFWRK